MNRPPRHKFAARLFCEHTIKNLYTEVGVTGTPVGVVEVPDLSYSESIENQSTSAFRGR